MRILILSDSHGDIESMRRAAERTMPDQIFHLGDCWRDGAALGQALPQLPLAQVVGNCDLADMRARGAERLVLTMEGQQMLLCHGHRYQVKRDLLALEYAARECGATLAIFGHTHRPYLETREGLTLLNPGSIGSPQHDFAVVEIEGGQMRAALLSL